MSGCLDNAHCPQFDLSQKRNQIASIVSGALVNIFSLCLFAFSLACLFCKNEESILKILLI